MADLTKNERRWLGKWVCAWCDQPMSSDECGAIYEKCSDEVRAKRREECLRDYAPRIRAVTGTPERKP